MLFAAYVGLWTLYAVVSTGVRDVHFDMAEAAVLSRDPAFGYPKHPPMSVWLAGLWFALFPLDRWAYYLLAFTMPAVALWCTWRLSERWLDTQKRVVGLALLMLVPFYNFHALKYNANTVLIPFWALTTLWFVRSFETRGPVMAALAGLAAAGAMLGKYWSVFLLAGLALAALLDSRRAAYFRSPAPWITAAVGLVALTPHLYWLVTHDFLPFSYALTVHEIRSDRIWLVGELKYLAGIAGYIAVPVTLALIAGGARLTTVADILFPPDVERRFPAMAFWGALLLPVAVAVPFGLPINSLWTMPSYTLLPVVLLSSPLLVFTRRAVVVIVALALALPVVAVLVSPLVGLISDRTRPPKIDFSQLAAAVEREWRETTPAPLRILAGDWDLAYGAAFRLTDRPSAFPILSLPDTAWITEARIAREGIAVVCASDDATCALRAAEQAARSAQARRSEVELGAPAGAAAAASRRYLIVTVPPQP
jgi:4-amino-4-deoxy-L-arabinose transferase-like glycosyltransferase